MQSQFENLRFESEAKFKEWLRSETMYVIFLKDKGQDMSTVWVHKSGEILNTDFQNYLYNGKFVDLKKLAVGNHLNIWHPEKKRYVIYEGLFIEKLICLAQKNNP